MAKTTEDINTCIPFQYIATICRHPYRRGKKNDEIFEQCRRNSHYGFSIVC